MFELKITIDTSPVLTNFLENITSLLSVKVPTKEKETPQQVNRETEEKACIDTSEEIEETRLLPEDNISEEQEQVSNTEEVTTTPPVDDDAMFIEMRKLSTLKVKEKKSKELHQLLLDVGADKLTNVKPKDYQTVLTALRNMQ